MDIMKPTPCETSSFTMGQAPFAEAHATGRSEEHTSELQSQSNLVCRLLLEKKNRRTLLSLRFAAISAFAIAFSTSIGSTWYQIAVASISRFGNSFHSVGFFPITVAAMLAAV